MLKSTIDVEINSTSWDRFKAMFDKYDEAVKKQPEIWKKIAAAQATGASNFEKTTRAMFTQIDSARDMTDALDKQNKTLTSSERLWTSIGRSTKNIAGDIASTATSLLKWTGILGLVGGALTMLNGTMVAGDRRSAKGRGLDIGSQSSFDVNMSRFFDPGTLMDRVGEMETDFRLQGPAYIGLHRGLTGNTEKDLLAFARAGWSTAHGAASPSQLGMKFQQAGLDMFSPADQFRLYNTNRSEFENQLAHYKDDKREMSINEKIALHAQEVATGFERAAKSTEAFAANALDPLMQKIPALIKEFTNLIGAFAKSDVIKEAVDSIADFADNIAHPGRAFEKSWNDAQKKPTIWPWDAPLKYLHDKAGWGGPDGSEHAAGLFGGLGGSIPGVSAVVDMWHRLERSAFNAISPKGAKGPFQFMPDAWRQYGAGGNPFDYNDSRAAAERDMKDRLKEFHGDVAKAFASINWGQGNVERAVAKWGGNWLDHAPHETQQYVGRGMVYIMNQTGGSAVVSTNQLGAGAQ